MVLLEPERTLKALPALLPGKEERKRTLSLLEWARRIEGITKEQRDMVDRIAAPLGPAAVRKKKRK